MRRHIFVTGATGYIARHIVLQALEAGYRVTGSTRDPGRAAAYRALLEERLGKAAADRFRLVALDLESDVGWAGAMDGADALIHTASPVPFGVPRGADALLGAAVGGTRRALGAARGAGIERVVVTSSSSAVMNAKAPPGGVYDDTCWTDPDDPTIGPYPRAKTLAEKAAWDIAGAAGLRMTSVNPTVVAGPPLDAALSASVKVFARLLKGRDPFLPRTGMTLIDVRDVAAAHLRALDRDETVGARLFLHERFLWAREIAALLKEAVPDSRVATREAPDLLFRALGLFDRKIAAIVPNLGVRPVADNGAALQRLDMRLRDTRETVRETARVLTAKGWMQ